MEKLCDLCNITVNKNAVFGDSSALAPGGVRVGMVFDTQYITIVTILSGKLKYNFLSSSYQVIDYVDLRC